MSTITKSSSILHTAIGVIQLIAVIGGGMLSLFPGVGAIGLGGGLTIVALVGAIKNLLVPILEKLDSSVS